MNSDDNQLARRETQLPISKPGNLLDSAFTALSKEEQQQLVAKAGEERIKIDASEKAADLRDRNSTADMVKTVQIAKALDHTKADHTIKAHMETASGHTTVEIKKNNNTVIIVVAVVIGLIVLVLFSR